MQSISQTDISKDSTIVISKRVAALIAKDLERGDKCAEVLMKTNEKLTISEAKVIIKDSIIKYHVANEHSYINDSISYFQKDSVRLQQIKIEKSNSKKFKRQRNAAGGTGIFVFLYAIYISLKTLLFH